MENYDGCTGLLRIYFDVFLLAPAKIYVNFIAIFIQIYCDRYCESIANCSETTICSKRYYGIHIFISLFIWSSSHTTVHIVELCVTKPTSLYFRSKILL